MQSKFGITGLGAAAVFFAGALSAHAANISGAVEAGYNLNLTISNGTKNGVTNLTNAGHAYDARSGSFTLNNAHLAISGSDSASGVGYGVETDFGSDASFDASSLGGPFDIQEAYLTYAIGSGLGMKAGKYATYEGIEVIEGGSNPTVTRGFLFWFAEPFTHTGLEFSYASGMLDVHLGAINGWDQVVNKNSVPSYIAKIGLNLGDPLALTLSSIAGPEAADNDNYRMSFDATGVSKSIPMVDLWFQANYGMDAKAGVGATTPGKDASWMGFGLQPLVHISKLFGLGLRYEYFMDDQLSRTGSTFFGPVTPAGINDLTLQNFSVAPTLWLTPSLTARAEFRMDMASEKVYLDSKQAGTKNQMEIAADVVATF